MTELAPEKCTHEDTTVVKACCTMRGSSGFIECGCNGVDEVICNNPTCSGFDEDDEELVTDCWG